MSLPHVQQNRWTSFKINELFHAESLECVEDEELQHNICPSYAFIADEIGNDKSF